MENENKAGAAESPHTDSDKLDAINVEIILLDEETEPQEKRFKTSNNDEVESSKIDEFELLIEKEVDKDVDTIEWNPKDDQPEPIYETFYPNFGSYAKCSVCSKSIEDSEHHSKDTTDRATEYKCSDCEKEKSASFSSRTYKGYDLEMLDSMALLEEMLPDDSSFSDCEIITDSSEEYEDHPPSSSMAASSKSFATKCNVCKESFNTPLSLTTHFSEKHKGQDLDVDFYECVKCNIFFETMNEIRLHFQSKHNDFELDFNCGGNVEEIIDLHSEKNGDTQEKDGDSNVGSPGTDEKLESKTSPSHGIISAEYKSLELITEEMESKSELSEEVLDIKFEVMGEEQQQS